MLGDSPGNPFALRMHVLKRFVCPFCLSHSRQDQKLLVEILDLFQLTHFDKALVLSASERLLVAKSYSAAIKLCGTFGHFEWPFEKMIKSMTHAKDWVSAELLVRNSERERDTSALIPASSPRAVFVRLICFDWIQKCNCCSPDEDTDRRGDPSPRVQKGTNR